MLGTDCLIEALVAEGADHLFMVPGGLVDPFLPPLARHPRLRPIEGFIEIVVLSGFYQRSSAVNQGFDIHHGEGKG